METAKEELQMVKIIVQKEDRNIETQIECKIITGHAETVVSEFFIVVKRFSESE